MSVTPHCKGCDYPLLGVASPRCPECGREFDARHPDTWTTNRLGYFGRWTHRPPGWIDFVLLIIAAALTLYAYSTPGLYARAMALAMAAWLAAGGLWLLRIAQRLSTHETLVPDRASGEKFWLRAAALPLVVLGCIVLIRQDAPVRLCFQMGRAGFDAAPTLRPPPFSTSYECQAGPYTLIRQPGRWDRTTPFKVKGDEQNGDSYFLYVPDETISNLRLSSPYARDCIQLSKNWFLWRAKRW